jgi:hypothetical protein
MILEQQYQTSAKCTYSAIIEALDNKELSVEEPTSSASSRKPMILDGPCSEFDRTEHEPSVEELVSDSSV